MKKILLLAGFTIILTDVLFAQLPVPTDYLSADFHKGRREALRKLMPANAVMAIFSYPVRNFSNDVDYKYHANPDLYYFTGYTEPDAVLLIFKDAQTDSAGKKYNELFFVRQNDALQEKWMGKRAGPEGVKAKWGFSHVANGNELAAYPVDLAAFDKIIFEFPKDISDDPNNDAEVFDLVKAFKKKAGIPADFDEAVQVDLAYLPQNPRMISAGQIPILRKYYIDKAAKNESFKNDPIVQQLTQVKDSAEAMVIVQKIKDIKWNIGLFNQYTSELRQIKTPEEMVLMRKAIDISCAAHNEAMKAVKPDMSELELQGIQEFIHKRLGAEYVGYPSIVGAGSNGCVLHYIENNVTTVGKQMVLMDVGAEYHGYTADVTRTFPATGKFSPEQKLIYDLVYEAQEAVFKKCKEGTTFREIEKTARDVLTDGLMKLGILKDRKDIRQFYPHGCSHYIGLDVHDKGDYQVLKENMIITVEPGIYIPEGSNCDKKWWSIAVRIEDDVRIGKDKFELLSNLAPRTTEAIEKMIAEKSFVDNMGPYVK